MKLVLIREHIIRPALSEIGAYSDDAASLVWMTGMAESLYRHVEQQGGGPALGWFQMEPATHDDIWVHYLGGTRRQHLLDGLRRLSGQPADAEELRVNPFYAAAMCRIHYLRDPKPLPTRFDPTAQAKYWKRVYNTGAGSGTVEGFLSKTSDLRRM